MPTQAQQEAMSLYAELMEEFKVRAATMRTVVDGVLPVRIAREFCFLQLRMICEVIALGCLVAHGDIKATRFGKLPKEYSADRILAQLSALHSDFYPYPVQQIQTAPNNFTLKPVTEGFLTKSELLTLNRRCGDALHRGNLKKLLGRTKSPTGHFDDIEEWRNRVVKLLSSHILYLFDGKTRFLCNMKTGEAGKVSVAIAELRTPL
jgi:hypothetical protein